MTSLRVCYVAPDVPIPNPRGASTHVFELARALRALGDEVHVVCRRERFQKREEEISGVVFHRVYRGLVGPLSASKPRAGSDTEAHGAKAAIYGLYLRSVSALSAGLVASRLARVYKLQVIIERETAFGAGAIASMISHKPMILELIGPRYSRLSASVSSKILAYNEKMIPRGSADKTIFVKAAVNPDLFKPDFRSRASVRQRLGIDDSIVVGYVGTSQAWHGLDDLIRAAKILHRSDPRIKFLLVGPMPGWARSRAELELVGSLILTGPVPYTSVANYINAADITVAPYNILKSTRRTKGIGSPLKVLEYMACGKAVVGSDLPQVTDLIDDRKNGLIFPQGSAEILAERIVELANDPSFREALGRSALEKVLREFSWNTFAIRLQAELSDCVRGQVS